MKLCRPVPVELGVGGLPDLIHAALGNESGHVVVPEAGAGTQSHGDLGEPAKYTGSGRAVPMPSCTANELFRFRSFIHRLGKGVRYTAMSSQPTDDQWVIQQAP